MLLFLTLTLLVAPSVLALTLRRSHLRWLPGTAVFLVVLAIPEIAHHLSTGGFALSTAAAVGGVLFMLVEDGARLLPRTLAAEAAPRLRPSRA